LYEHQNNISELKGESTVALKLAQDENRSNELDLRKDKRSLKVELKEQELAHEDVIKNLKKVCFFRIFQYKLERIVTDKLLQLIVYCRHTTKQLLISDQILRGKLVR